MRSVCKIAGYPAAGIMVSVSWDFSSALSTVVILVVQLKLEGHRANRMDNLTSEDNQAMTHNKRSRN